uniref:EH domain containing 4 n=2 Tax=Equus caballus TaxID=9796 RepID=A0A9L0RW84_HORSE
MSTLDEVVGTKCDPVEYLKHPPLTLLVEICLPLGCFICGRGRAVAAMLSPCPFVQLMESLSASGVSSGRSLLHTRASLKCAPCWQCESSCWILSPGCVSTLLIMEDLLSQLNLPSIMLRQKLSPCPWRSRRAGPSSDHKNSFPSCWARWVTELDIWRVDRVKTVDELLLLESRLRVLRAVAEGRSCWVDPVHPLACRAVQPRLRACWTPGAAAGGSGYDFCQVLQWFAERVDRIILLFDAHKLDISDEFSEAIKAFRGQDDKIRVVLNKADQVDTQQLMRVYGALMWSLGKVINTPEVLRVYIGSFWAQPLQNTDNRRLFEAEAQDLFRDIQSLPQKAAVRKLNDLIKRARLAKVHAYIISYLKKEMPSVFGKENKKRELISRLPEIYIQLQREYQISAGDFPEVKAMQEQLENYDFTKFHSLKPKLIEAVDNMLSNKISSLMSLISQEEMSMPTQLVQGGAFDGTAEGPFNQGYGEGAKEGADEEEWVVAKDKPIYDELFYTLSPINGKISGVNAKKEMVTSKLPNSVLGKIWKLADCDCDGMLDEEEFALAKHLIKIKLDGYELPNSLPPHLVPPSHRKSLP